MNITTRYSIGSLVIADIDDAYVKAEVNRIRIYVTAESMQISYELTAKWRASVGTADKPQWTTLTRATHATQEELDERLALYERCKQELDPTVESDKREKQILWNMRFAKNKKKERPTTNEAASE